MVVCVGCMCAFYVLVVRAGCKCWLYVLVASVGSMRWFHVPVLCVCFIGWLHVLGFLCWFHVLAACACHCLSSVRDANLHNSFVNIQNNCFVIRIDVVLALGRSFLG